MANQLFPYGKEGLLDGSIDWDTDDIRAAHLETYTFDATDKFLADVVGVIAARSASLTSKTVALGVADAADPSTVIAAGAQIQDVIIFKHTGSDATARVIVHIDSATNLPVTPNGGAIAIAWDNGANKIFAL